MTQWGAGVLIMTAMAALGLFSQVMMLAAAAAAAAAATVALVQ